MVPALNGILPRGPRAETSPFFLSVDKTRPLTYAGAIRDFKALLSRVSPDDSMTPTSASTAFESKAGTWGRRSTRTWPKPTAGGRSRAPGRATPHATRGSTSLRSLTFLSIWWPYTMGLPLLVQGMARLRTAATAIDAEVDAEVRQFYEGGRRE